MPSLRGLAEMWEQVSSVRARVRQVGSVFERPDGLPHANVKQCGKFKDVLEPLLKAILTWPRNSAGKIQMCSVFQTETELAKLYRLLKVQTDAKQVKAEAWLCKKFVVLLKRKKQRRQIPRCEHFRELLEFIPDQDDDDDHDAGDHPLALDAGDTGSTEDETSLHDSDVELLSSDDDNEPDKDDSAFAETQVDTQVDDACVIVEAEHAPVDGETAARPSSAVEVASEAPATDAVDAPPVAPESAGSRRPGPKGKMHCFDSEVVDVDEMDQQVCDACERKLSKCHCMQLRQLKQSIYAMKNLQAARKRSQLMRAAREKSSGEAKASNEKSACGESKASDEKSACGEAKASDEKSAGEAMVKVVEASVLDAAATSWKDVDTFLEVTRRGQLAAREHVKNAKGGPGDDSKVDCKKAKKTKPLKRPAACSVAAPKRAKCDEKELEPEAGDEKPSSEANVEVDTKPMEKDKAEAKKCGKHKRKPKEADLDDIADNATVYFGADDVPRPIRSPSPEPELETTSAGATGRGRGRGGRGGKGRGRQGRGHQGRGDNGGVAESVASKAGRGRGTSSAKGKGRDKTEAPAEDGKKVVESESKPKKSRKSSAQGEAALEETTLKTFARRRQPKQPMNKARFIAIRDAFDTFVRDRLPEFPSKFEDPFWTYCMAEWVDVDHNEDTDFARLAKRWFMVRGNAWRQRLLPAGENEMPMRKDSTSDVRLDALLKRLARMDAPKVDWHEQILLACVILIYYASNVDVKFLEAFDALEFFSGAGNVSRMLRFAGHAVGSFDIKLGNPAPGKQNAMDLLTDAGMAFFGCFS
ncbi:hypothetical protein AK812_SmicGene11497 [Symbiodinium microadriaticum]|uniref:Uncharacterized protein n=1 Tax=Symbiodinium microadriaticum TaxID=2951 RepID=A0A1Q9ED06_SYMMI|nr:hypothetical protein AK812_SmicGene11497 [Symbiodinium microadriaticum]CAE7676048.1 unnamed protein product [Symbiodinium microadriaticum]CAE7892606.1 unnamed protein product [Symbiodinium sp. KB8]